MFGRQCTGYHRRATPTECGNCGSTEHKYTECTRPKEPKENAKGKGKTEEIKSVVKSAIEAEKKAEKEEKEKLEKAEKEKAEK